ncbi:hypothetical protein [Planobispora takensis]|nr:hypothetical protein [Planobispora takensis]
MLGIVGVPLLALVGLMVMQWLESTVLSSPAEAPSMPVAPSPSTASPSTASPSTASPSTASPSTASPSASSPSTAPREEEPREQARHTASAHPSGPSSSVRQAAPGRRTATACRVRTRHGAVLPARPHRIGGSLR